MKLLYFISAVGLVVLFFLWKKPTAPALVKKEVERIPGIPGAIYELTLDELYEKHGRLNGLDPLLLKAIAQVESSENPLAKNPADPSYGLMQLLCIDDGKGSCANRLNVLDWPPVYISELYDPDYSLHIGAQILAWNIDRYGFRKGIAVYNSWGAHDDPREGPFRNQAYVDKVLSRYGALTPSIAYA